MFDVFLALVFLFGFGYTMGITKNKPQWAFLLVFFIWPILLGYSIGTKK